MFLSVSSSRSAMILGTVVLLLTSLLGCGDDSDSDMLADPSNGTLLGGNTSSNTTISNTATSNTTTPSDTPTSNGATTEADAKVGPTYSNGTCPALIDGVNNGFESAGLSRSFILDLPAEPNGAPVVFAWHWLGGTASQIHNFLGFEQLVEDEGVIVVAPESEGTQFEWRFVQGPEGNADLLLFDDLLACLWEQYDVDLDQVFATGMSAGGLWTSYLTIHRAQWLASTAPMSGGADPSSYTTPERPIPVLLIWGGETDIFQNTVNFHTSSQFLSQSLRDDGHFVAHCVHDMGHVPPPNAANLVWSWFEAHPDGIAEEPFKDGLPGNFPDFCTLP